jgi:NAD(P)-dependent dehydrogenase (short-subunit alcohol dehydrogenase family)
MKTIFITGATSGIGLITASELAAQGNKIFATARNLERGNELLTHYRTKYPTGKGVIKIVVCDLSSFESIVKACNQVKLECSCIDVLINNAGVWNFSYRESQNHIEETLQVNVLAPLLINHLLLDLLVKSKQAKLIFTASALHQGDVDFSNLESKKEFSGFKTYRQSKLEVILLCRLLAKKLATVNIGVYCNHPGLVNTKLGRDANWFSNLFFRVMGISPEKGARTLIYLAEEDKQNLVSGEYYAKMEVKKITKQSYDLMVAQKLLDTLEVYIKDYVATPSLIFETSIKKNAEAIPILHN